MSGSGRRSVTSHDLSRQRLFNCWATTYDCLLPSVFYQAAHQRLLSYVSLPVNSIVLDIGCGTGRLLNRLAANFPNVQGIGLDFSMEMLRRARTHNHHRPRLLFIQGTARALPFAGRQFDAVFCTFSFLHYPEPQIVLGEVRRVLQRRAHFYWVDPTIPPWGTSWASPTSDLAVRFYNQLEREDLGRAVDLTALSHHHPLGNVLLTIFTAL